MPRKPSMWWRESHGAWYTTIAGKQVRLDPDQKTAQKEFYRLMLGSPASPRPRLKVAELTDLWLEAAECARSTYLVRQRFGQQWCNAFGRLHATELRPYHVSAWLARHASWARSTRSLATSTIKQCFRWGRVQGHLESSPLDLLKVGKIGRRKPATEEDLVRWLAACDEPAVRDYTLVAIDTGGRPGELASMTASGLDRTGRGARVFGKMGERLILVPDRAWKILEDLAVQRPDGPLLRSPRGCAWNRHSLHFWFARISERAGVKLVPYHLRSLFATQSLRVNGEIVTAKLLGHRGLEMLADHYADPTAADLRAAIGRIRSE